jgi:hypothetical protein
VSQDELRVSKKTENLTGTVRNNAWDGTTIKLSGARNESVSFNLVLEAAANVAPRVSVSFDTLTGPNGTKIQTTQQATGNDLFSWVNRPIELFYTRYLQIKGVSAFGWWRGNENQVPLRFQTKTADRRWVDRPDHDKFYPDILVPIELVPTFTIASGQNESIWGDIYVPKGTPAGTYTGTVTVSENGATTHAIPVSLTVQPFTLPDVPSVKGFSYLDATEIEWRYVTGQGGYVNPNDPGGIRVRHILDVYYQFFHRHRIDLIGGEAETPAGTVGIHPWFTPRYDGSLYTASSGYEGPGVGTGNTLYSVGPYGTWGRNITDEKSMWNFANPTGDWFAAHMPNLEYFIYLEDEPSSADWPTVENWAKWLAEDPGNGHNMLSMSTVGLSAANTVMPDLDIATAATSMGECPLDNRNSCDNTAFTQNALSTLLSKPNRHFWAYGSTHPGSGTFNTEDDGIATRTIPWVQAKLGIERYFQWYANLNTQADWFQQAATWDYANAWQDPMWGENRNQYTNGNGLIVYPGTDVGHPQDSYGVDGPFASVRLKEWRRGTNDGDYLALAKSIDPNQTAAILSKVMPKAIWEVHAPGWPVGDPTYSNDAPSWSSNPDDWEAARAQLAAIISKSCGVDSSASYCQ